MQLLRTVCVAFCLWAVPVQAAAGPYSDKLAKCLVNSTTGAEKSDLIRWVLAAVSLHPDLKGTTATTDSQRDDASKAIARLFERLLAESCNTELLDAMKFEGAGVVPASIQVLAESAWVGVLSQPNVSGFFTDFTKYVDVQRLRTVAQAFDAATLVDGPAVRVVSDSSTTVLELWGLEQSDLAKLKEQKWAPLRWTRLWRIADPNGSTSTQATVSDGPALAGSYVVTDRTIVFVPTIALKHGASYVWYFFPGELPSSPAPSEPRLAWRRADFISMEVRVP